MTNDVTVVIPTIPPRAGRLQVAMNSVFKQTYPAAAIAVAVDHDHDGAAITRDRALDMVKTPYVAFLDDDDYFKANHLEALMETMLAEDADFVYSWYDVAGNVDPRAEEFGVPWDDENPKQTTITTMVKTELAQKVGFVIPEDTKETLTSPDRLYAGEDWYFTQTCWKAGAKIVHRPEKTWVWNHHGLNTSGLGKNW